MKVGSSLSKTLGFLGASLCLFSGNSAQKPRKIQYRALGRYGVGEPSGAGCSELNTNSGESSLERWSKNEAFHGAGLGACAVEVEAMVRWRVRFKRLRRGIDLDAMVAVLL